MIRRLTHLDTGCAPRGLRPSTLISLGLTFSTWISRTSGSRNVGSICGIGALTEIGGATWTCGAAEGVVGSCASDGAFSACACSSVSIAKTSCGSVSFSVGVDCIGGPLLYVTRIRRRACFAAWKTLCPESLVQAAHGQRGLTKARRSRGEVEAAGSGYWNRCTKECEGN